MTRGPRRRRLRWWARRSRGPRARCPECPRNRHRGNAVQAQCAHHRGIAQVHFGSAAVVEQIRRGGAFPARRDEDTAGIVQPIGGRRVGTDDHDGPIGVAHHPRRRSQRRADRRGRPRDAHRRTPLCARDRRVGDRHRVGRRSGDQAGRRQVRHRMQVSPRRTYSAPVALAMTIDASPRVPCGLTKARIAHAATAIAAMTHPAASDSDCPATDRRASSSLCAPTHVPCVGRENDDRWRQAGSSDGRP